MPRNVNDNTLFKYYDYQLSKARGKFGYEVSGLKVMVLSRATYLVSVGNINSRRSPVASRTISRALLPMTSKVDKLPMDTEPVARDNNTIFTLKLVTKLSSRLTQLIIVVSEFELFRKRFQT